MAISARAYFLAGTLLALGSLTAGVVHCAQQGEGAPWRNLVSVSAPAGAERPAPQAVPAEARCPVCGMYPARFPAWAAQVHLRDGSIRFFDSPVEFFRWLGDLRRYGQGVAAGDIVAGYVTDHVAGGWLAVGDAWYVRGSSVGGPMREDALPAFATREAAAAFVAQNGGELLAFTEAVAAVAMGGAHGHHH